MLYTGRAEYAVIYKKEYLSQHSTLGLSFIDNDVFGNDISIGPATITEGTDDYILPEGKTSKVHDTYKEAKIPLQERSERND